MYKFSAKVVVWPGEVAAWRFAHLPIKLAQEIQKKFGDKKRGWNSLPVLVTAGKTSWKTSIFFDRRSKTYLLPLKAEIRRKEDIADGETVKFKIEIKF